LSFVLAGGRSAARIFKFYTFARSPHFKLSKFALTTSSMRIAVIADTHGSLPPSVAGEIAGADEIWHLGDFCNHATLDVVRKIGPPVEAVLGNNDYGLNLSQRLLLERAGKTFLLIHIPPTRPGGADFLLHGHTHVPRDEFVGPTRVLNPGSTSKANKGAPASWAWLIIDESGSSVEWRIQPVKPTKS
jgi:putative phosphoesterase